ncbi:hypothetical protein D9R14_06350 [Xanthobacter tagetidis]|uniref:Uncharacterized protein n=1 Tax=Xanthobacter tagetidis TaxID=60216 RepID=A0A3L7AHL5_9HYPH|nr:hypothetical protein D9R14_06350 [Xanthobacter tagetidis]
MHQLHMAKTRGAVDQRVEEIGEHLAVHVDVDSIAFGELARAKEDMGDVGKGVGVREAVVVGFQVERHVR